MRRTISFIAVFTFAFCLVAVAAEEPKKEVKVYVTKDGKKYHLADCRYVKDKKDLTEYTVTEAKKKGLEACKVCKPPEEPQENKKSEKEKQ